MTFEYGDDDITVTGVSFADAADFTAVAETLQSSLTGGNHLTNPQVSYTGLRFVLTATTTPPATTIVFPSSDTANLADMVGWTKARGASEPAYTCCMGDDAATAGWQTIKTDISRPSGEDINQFLVTVDDVGRTDYRSRFIPNADWEFRIRALNRRAPAGAMNAGNLVPDTGPPVPLNWSATIEATPGADSALKRPERLTVTRSEEDNEGRTGLILTWNKATTVKGSNVNPTNAVAYRIEYSNTGPRDEGYDWKVLDESYKPNYDDTDGADTTQDPLDAALSRQTVTDNHESGLVTAETLAAGQTRHYRVFALTAELPAGPR